MYQVILTVNDIDYTLLASFVGSSYGKKLKDSGSSTAQMLFENLKRLPTGLMKNALAILPKENQNELVKLLFNASSDIVVKKLNIYLASENWGISFSSASIEKSSTGGIYDLVIQTQKIQFGTLIEKIFPILSGELSKNPSLQGNIVIKLLPLLEKIPSDLLQDFAISLPEEWKDELWSLLLSEYQYKIIGFSNNFMKENSIAVEIGRIATRPST